MRLKTTTALASLLLLMPMTVNAAETAIFPDLVKAKEAFRSQNYTVAAQNWMPLAQSGIPEAQVELGKLYSRGRGVKKNYQTALNLFMTAANKGDARAMFEIGRAYEKGYGVNKDVNKAKEWYQLAASSGYGRGDFSIGELHEKNKFNAPPKVEKSTRNDIRNAVNAINTGNYEQAEYLADLYQRGIGVPQNNQKSLTYYLTAAKNGSARARTQADILKTRAPLNEYLKAEKDSDLLLAREDKAFRAERKEIIRDLKRIERPTVPPAVTEQQKAIATQYYERAAQNGYKRANDKLAVLAGVDPIPTPEKKPQRYKIKSELKTQFIGEENLDLGTRDDDLETAFVLDGKIGAFIYPTDDITGFVEVRGLHSDGVATSDSDDDEDTQDLSFIELRQAWVEFDNLFGIRPLALKLGRQRFYEPRGLWWNRDFDAVRLSLNSTLANGFIAIGENQDQYRIGDDNELDGDEEDRLRVLAELSHNYGNGHFIETRFLFEDDQSGSENIGQIVSNNDRDDEDFTLLWSGIRARGTVEPPRSAFSKIQYRTDLIAVAGEETLVNSTGNTGTDTRTVNSVEDRDVLGWAFDGSVNLQLDNTLEPTVTLGYAYGSGDDGSGDNGAFRQTGLDGNTSRFPERRASSPLRNYGEVLRPELSNLHIANLGVNLPILKASDINLNYFAYWLDEDATSLRSSNVSASLNGQDDYLGQALDLAAHIKIGKELNLSNPVLRNSDIRIRLGSFQAGDAFGVAEDEYAYRGSSEFRIKF